MSPELQAAVDAVDPEQVARRLEVATANTLANMRLLARCNPCWSLLRRASGCAAVVVGAGPSLTKNVGDLARNQQHVLVLTGSRALPTLLEAGVRVDIAGIIDPMPAVRPHFDELTDRDLLRVGCWVITPSVDHEVVRRLVETGAAIELWSARRHRDVTGTLGEDAFWRATREIPWRALSAGNITSALVSLAFLRPGGPAPIALVGSDLALDPESGLMHCRGDYSEPAELWVPQWGVTLGDEGISGSVPTTRTMAVYARWLEESAAAINATPVQRQPYCNWNCTEGGRHLAHWREARLAVWLADLRPAGPARAPSIVGNVQMASPAQTRARLRRIDVEEKASA